MSNVFVIIDEWTSTSGATSSEVTDNRFFTSESEAWDALRAIAEAWEYDLGKGDNSIGLDNPVPGMDYEEYYIQELTKGD